MSHMLTLNRRSLCEPFPSKTNRNPEKFRNNPGFLPGFLLTSLSGREPLHVKQTRPHRRVSGSIPGYYPNCIHSVIGTDMLQEVIPEVILEEDTDVFIHYEGFGFFLKHTHSMCWNISYTHTVAILLEGTGNCEPEVWWFSRRVFISIKRKIVDNEDIIGKCG